MKKFLACALLMNGIAAYASNACNMAYPKSASAKQIRILSKKFNLTTGPAKFKLGEITTHCYGYTNNIFGESKRSECRTWVQLLDQDGAVLTSVVGPIVGDQDRSMYRALRDLPNCLRKDI